MPCSIAASPMTPQLYRDRLADPLLVALGAYATIVELLSPLFTQGFDQPPALLRKNVQSYIANELAVAFGHLGDQTQTQRLNALGIGWACRSGTHTTSPLA